MNFYQIFLPLSSVLYLLIVFVLRSVIHYRRTGINPFVFGSSDRAHDYLARVYKIMVAGTIVSIGIFSFFPDYYALLFPIWYLEAESIRLIGIGLLILSFVWTSVAQYQMASSWRIGIDYNEKTQIISKGLFRYSRNPVFLGVIISYFGTFLVIPNMLSFMLLILTYVVIQLQVRMEEEHLITLHGATYSSYKGKVKRWL